MEWYVHRNYPQYDLKTIAFGYDNSQVHDFCKHHVDYYLDVEEKTDLGDVSFRVVLDNMLFHRSDNYENQVVGGCNTYLRLTSEYE